jgi:hypothetical protein
MWPRQKTCQLIIKEEYYFIFTVLYMKKLLSIILFVSICLIFLPLQKSFAQTSWPFTKNSCWCTGTYQDCDSTGTKCRPSSVNIPDTYSQCIDPRLPFAKPSSLSSSNFPIRQNPNPNAPDAWFSTVGSQADCEQLIPLFNQNFKDSPQNVLGNYRVNQFNQCTFSADTDCSAAKNGVLPPSAQAEAQFEVRKPILSILIPDLSFSDITTTTDENGNIQIPWIGEYIVAIYRLLVNVASILGVILIIREGIRVILSAGGDGKIEGYKNIGRIIIGLLLAWFSYVILYNLNSSLVSIRPLNIRAVTNNIVDNSIQEDEESDDDKVTAAVNKSNQETTQASPNLTPTTKCPWKSRDEITYSQCQEWVNSKSITFNGQKFTAANPCGAAPDDGRFAKFDSCINPKTGQSEPILDLYNHRTTVTVIKSMQAPLCRAIMIARNQSPAFDIRVNSSYRAFGPYVFSFLI